MRDKRLVNVDALEIRGNADMLVGFVRADRHIIQWREPNGWNIRLMSQNGEIEQITRGYKHVYIMHLHIHSLNREKSLAQSETSTLTSRAKPASIRPGHTTGFNVIFLE